jgi:hypothetical protein
LLLSDDLQACADWVARTEPGLTLVEGATLFQKSERARELLAFWISEIAMNQRRRAGLLPL